MTDKFMIGRHIEGITLNPVEIACDDKGDNFVFDTKEELKQYIVDCYDGDTAVVNEMFENNCYLILDGEGKIL